MTNSTSISYIPATLTIEHSNTLKRPFSRADHEFVRSFVYLTEEAICNRIEEVDPAWTFELQRMERNGEQSTVCARLTICGVSREGVGMQQFNEKAPEAEKGAATDALKRCARLFGIGRYLLDAPKEGTAFDGWLAKLQKGSVPPTPAPQAPPASSASTPPTVPANGGSPDSDPTLYADVFAIKWCDRKDGSGTFYRLTGLDAHDSEIEIVAFDTTALDLMGFDLKAITKKNYPYKNYDVRIPYTLSEKDGQQYKNLDAARIKADKHFEEV